MQSGPADLPQAPRAAVYFDTSRLGAWPSVSDLLRSQSGAIRVVTNSTVFEFSSGRFVKLEDPRLRAAVVYAGEDREGNLWLANGARRGIGVSVEEDPTGAPSRVASLAPSSRVAAG